MPNTVFEAHGGSGYTRRDGTYVESATVNLLPAQIFVAGTTLGPVVELARATTLRARLRTIASSGGQATLAVAVQTSHDGVTNWRSVAAFAPQTTAAGAMTSANATGTNPPALTLTGLARRPLRVRIGVAVPGPIGTAKLAFSLDGGETFGPPVLAASSMPLLDEAGAPTGITLSFGAGPFALDNAYAATNGSDEEKAIGGLDRFVRLVVEVGGDGSASVSAFAVGEVS